MTELLHRDSGAPLDRQGRTVTVRLCTYGTPSQPIRPLHRALDFPGIEGRDVYREQFSPGAVAMAPNVHVTDFHGSELIGRALPDTFHDTPAGPVVDVALAQTAAGNDMLALLEADVIRSVSMEFAPAPGAGTWDGDLLTRSDVTVHGLAFAFRPAHQSPVLAVREQATTQEEPIMETDTPATIDRADITAEIDATVARSLEGIDEQVRQAITATPAVVTPGTSPLAEFGTFAEYALRSFNEPGVGALLWRVLADQITDNNDGVILPTWVQDVKRIVDQGRAVIGSFGTVPLPPEGMEVSWPFTNTNIGGLVTVQAAQKTDINSVQVDIQRDAADIATYAGGSDVSLQLIMRSSPAYMDVYLRLMSLGYAAATDIAAAAQVDAASTVNQVFDWLLPGDGAELREAVGIASRKVETATGTPAEFVLLPTANFDQLFGMADFQDTAFPVFNTPGGGNARTLQFFISGVPVVHAPHMLEAVGGIVSNASAWTWNEQGPMTVEAADVEKLGRNVAVWGMGVGSAYVPAGIVTLDSP